MGQLDTYRAKRDFSRTTEPAGGAPEAGGSRFVVQRHRARRLHYDFRLEIDGVLVSWAVPKGPSLDPSAKRLAVRTEDHPIEYMDFEGVIPAGEYGGGDVIVWDRGTWELHVPDGSPEDPGEALDDGELHVDLHGEKLTGRFVLVRRGRGGEQSNEWLMFHKRDDDAVDGWDAEDHPVSVLSGRTNDEVAEDPDALWRSGAPADSAEIDLTAAPRADLSDRIEPMQPTSARSLPADDGSWLYGVRWEGRRVQVVVADGRTEIRDVDGRPVTAGVPRLRRSWTSAREAVVDAVLVQLDDSGRPIEPEANDTSPADTNAVESPMGTPQLQILDLLHLDGRRIADLPLQQRLGLLDGIVADGAGVRVVAQTNGSREGYVEATAGVPGAVVMARSARSRYRSGARSSDWREWSPTARTTRRARHRRTPKRSTPDDPAAVEDRSEPERAVPTGRDDPTAPEALEALEALDRLGANGTWRFAGRDLRLTNLDKQMAPGRGDEPPITKRDLVRYYAQVAPVMLPHLVDRPMNMHRFPAGLDRPGFWNKAAPDHAPDWMGRWENDEADPGETEVYLVATEPAAVPWFANYGALELHPWTSRIPAVHEPTYAYIDLDPGDATTWDELLLMARLHRDALAHLEVRGWPKVTGRRGIQIWIPVPDGTTFEETRGWVESLSRLVGRLVPDLVSWEWEVGRRRGRARLDYTQNAINKTLVAPYSVRPAAGAPVSAPIRWEELDDPDLRPDRWTIRNMPERVAEVGDLFAGITDDPQQLPELG